VLALLLLGLRSVEVVAVLMVTMLQPLLMVELRVVPASTMELPIQVVVVQAGKLTPLLQEMAVLAL
jgi:hypothetical protein